MEKVRKIISEIVEKQEINTVYFVGCGGSLSGFFPAKYFLSEETKKIKVGYMNANEFVHATPKEIGKDTVVITASQRGNTAETVKATAVANELGAATVGLTFQVPSPLSDTAQYVIQYEFGPESVVENQKVSYGFKLALEILNEEEGYEKYDEMVQALAKLNDIVVQAKKDIVPDAIKWAWEFKDDSVIYTMGSGACWGPAHQEAICIFMEMQWINASVIHSGEFFHGPFEITDKDVPFILLMNDGRTRQMDARALTFLNRFDAKIEIVDALDWGLSAHIAKEVLDYFNPFVITAVFRVYAEELAEVRQHPLTKRRYMWKLEY